MAWAFPDTGSQVTQINPAMVAAMGGANLVTPASLQIKDARNHLIEAEGAMFIVVTRKDNFTGLKRRTFQMAYISPRAEDIVLLREAMKTLGLVSNLDNRREASVCHISETPADGSGTSLTPADGGDTGSHISHQIKSNPTADRHRSFAPNSGSGTSGEFAQDEVEYVGFQLTKDSIKPGNSMTESIRNFPAPKNITQARALFCIVEPVSFAFLNVLI